MFNFFLLKASKKYSKRRDRQVVSGMLLVGDDGNRTPWETTKPMWRPRHWGMEYALRFLVLMYFRDNGCDTHTDHANFGSCTCLVLACHRLLKCIRTAIPRLYVVSAVMRSMRFSLSRQSAKKGTTKLSSIRQRKLL